MRIGRAGALLASLAVCAVLVAGCLRGAGPLPPLGPTFNPGTGVWAAAAAAPLRPESLRVPGLRAPVMVSWDGGAVPHLSASRDDDLFRALGYLHARDRLAEMDLERRQAEGRLAQILGPSALAGDELQLDLGLARTAAVEWRQLPPSSAARQAIEAYSAGINARIDQDKAAHQLPMLFTLLGYSPEPWLPTDSIVQRGLLAEDLAYQKGPLYGARLSASLGEALTRSWFPVLPPNEQHPWAQPGAAPTQSVPSLGPIDPGSNQAAAAALARLGGAGARQLFGASNSWAVDGTRSISGKPVMANDPHLSLTLPSIWYQVDLASPGYHVAGVTIPGAPVVLIGHNQHISWGATDTQAQATLYYRETTSTDHPNRYLWKGQWRRFEDVGYDIPVRGAASVHHSVRLSAHGPLLTEDGQTLSVQWVADSPAPDTFDGLLNVMRAGNWAQFTGALRGWVGPIQNWTYADDAGNIGAIAPGLYPLVAGGDPSYPLAGTGENDVASFIPFEQVPRVYDPPGHVIVTANQRPVGAGYPYFIGSTLDTFDPGYRASEILSRLRQAGPLDTSGMREIQADVRDDLAVRLLPALRSALAGPGLTGPQPAARDALDGWNGEMDASSVAATIWDRFWSRYLDAVFKPWWDAHHVSVPMRDVSVPLTEDLEAWTLHDPRNPAFTSPGGSSRSAPQVMAQAFRSAVADLSSKFGTDISTWRWGRVHTRAVPSLAGISTLGYGPVPSGGDAFTPNAAGGSPSTHGPSWRMVIDWGGAAGGAMASGIYPGGQSENPASDHYRDLIPDWTAGRLRPMGAPGGSSIAWTLSP